MKYAAALLALALLCGAAGAQCEVGGVRLGAYVRVSVACGGRGGDVVVVWRRR